MALPPSTATTSRKAAARLAMMAPALCRMERIVI
jgi:hypothetical protein